MKIRVARYKDKEGVNFEDDTLASLKSWSTQGRWHYVAWVEQGEWSKFGYSKETLVPGESNSTFEYDPQIHDAEVWPRPIHVPPFMNRMSFALRDLDAGTAEEFIEGLKQLIAQACAMGAGDTHKDGRGIFVSEEATTEAATRSPHSSSRSAQGKVGNPETLARLVRRKSGRQPPSRLRSELRSGPLGGLFYLIRV